MYYREFDSPDAKGDDRACILDPQCTDEYYLLTTTIQHMMNDIGDIKIHRKADIEQREDLLKEMRDSLKDLRELEQKGNYDLNNPDHSPY